MTERVPEPTAFGAAVMDIALERGVGNQANLELPDYLHEALEDHVRGIRNHDHQELCLCVALAFGMDPGCPATKRDAKDCMRLAVAYTFPLAKLVKRL